MPEARSRAMVCVVTALAPAVAVLGLDEHAVPTPAPIAPHARAPEPGSPPPPTPGDAALRRARPESTVPRLVTLRRLHRRVEARWEQVTLEDALNTVSRAAGVDTVVLWLDEDNPTLGLHPERRVTLQAHGLTLIELLEKVLERADSPGRGSTWQISDTGTVQVGPRERLDRWVRTESYDVADLLLVLREFIPRWAEKDQWKGGFVDDRNVDDRAEDLRQVILQACEPGAWIDNGGTAATIRWHRGSRAFIVRAPDYVHRSIDGYRFNPEDRMIPEGRTPQVPPSETPKKPVAPPAAR